MKPPKILKFILVGYFFAQIIEFQFNILVGHTYGNWIFTLIAYPAGLAVAYWVNQALDKILKNKKVADLLYYIVMTSVGLFGIEWAVIGHTPWQSPDANQLGMLSFWAAVFFIPRIFVDQRPSVGPLKKNIRRYITVYTIITLTLGLVIPYPFNMIPIIWGEIIGYTYLHLFYYLYIFKQPKP